MPNQHLEDQLQAHIAEITGYIEGEHLEMEKMGERIQESKGLIKKAQADLSRASRALAALRGDDEAKGDAGMVRPLGPELDRVYGGSKHPKH